MDKTGTITKGNFIVQNSVCADKDMTPDGLLAVSASCELSSTHPIGNSIVEAAKSAGIEIERPSKVEEIAGHGIRAEIGKGVALCGNRKPMEANGVDLSGYKKEQFGTEVLVALDGRFVGHIVIADTIKPDAAIVMVAGLFGFANMWVAVFADTGVSVLCLLDPIRILYRK